MADLDWGRVVNIGGGVLLILFGVWVAARRPFRRENLAFGVFSAAYGSAPLLFNLALAFGGSFTVRYAIPSFVAYVFWIIGLAAVAAWFPSRITRADWRKVAFAAAFGLVPFVIVLYRLAAVGITAPTVVEAPLSSWIHYVHGLAATMASSMTWASLMLFALRFRELPDGSKQHAAYALMGCALVLYPGFNAPVQLQRTLLASDSIQYNASLLVCLLALAVGAAWLRNTLRSPHRHLARNVALFTFAIPTIGLLIGSFEHGHDTTTRFGVSGLLRVATVAILGYAVLKHQLLGIDVKLRFAIKTSTVAAIFLAVLFVVANIAQNFLGQKGVVVGGAAAGLLFFAIHPIQRMAERLSVKAVPLTAPSAAVGAGSKESLAYKAAIRAAMRDGRVTRREEEHLAEVAEHLGLSPMKMMALRRDVEESLPSPSAPRQEAR